MPTYHAKSPSFIPGHEGCLVEDGTEGLILTAERSAAHMGPASLSGAVGRTIRLPDGRDQLIDIEGFVDDRTNLRRRWKPLAIGRHDDDRDDRRQRLTCELAENFAAGDV